MSLPTPELATPPQTKTFRLLLIDDESSIRENLKEYLTSYHQADYGLVVDDAATVQEALALLNSQPYDLVISDINLPDRDGFYLLREAKTIQPNVKRALITAYDLDSYIKMAKDEQVYNIITKTAPFNFEELSMTVHNLLFPADAMGLDTYIKFPVEPLTCIEVRCSDDIMASQEALKAFFNRFELPDVEALAVVMVEAITNAVYHAPKNPDGSLKYNKGDVIEHLAPSEAVHITFGYDQEKLGVSIRDSAGSISAEEIIYWLERNISGESLLDTHGRGIYLIYKLMDRVILNLYKGHHTELVLLHYLYDPPPDNKPLFINELG